ncbi:hypothetical protein LA080_012307 [Diaporthe eres]|nr:hypothetical protein LA080_012307 [Diaporthe eres]
MKVGEKLYHARMDPVTEAAALKNPDENARNAFYANPDNYELVEDKVERPITPYNTVTNQPTTSIVALLGVPGLLGVMDEAGGFKLYQYPLNNYQLKVKLATPEFSSSSTSTQPGTCKVPSDGMSVLVRKLSNTAAQDVDSADRLSNDVASIHGQKETIADVTLSNFWLIGTSPIYAGDTIPYDITRGQQKIQK